MASNSSTSATGSGGGTTKKKKTPSANLATPAYDEKKYRKGIDTSYYTKAINDYTAQAERQRASQLAEAKKTQDSALKQAYITKVQNQNKLNEALATSGIRGGATETSNLRLQNTYGTAVGAANSDYSNSVNSINQAINQNIADYRSDMESRAEEYRQNLAQARWQAAREDALNKYNAQNEFWNNYYLDYYSGSSKNATSKAYKNAVKAYKNAKTATAKRTALQRIRGIQNRRGVIANTKK